MLNAIDFTKWALSHTDPETIPDGAELPLPLSECGTEPWHYLFGTVKVHTTPEKIEERFVNFYSTHGWSRAQYEYATKDFQPEDYATDCAGILDAYLTEKVKKTDNNANGYYSQCTERGKIKSVKRPYVLGEPVFMAKSSGRMHHIGFVCGFLNGEPLILEARGLSYGVVITKFSERGWTHRGLLTDIFYYNSEPVVFKLESPMMRGPAVQALQTMLNEAGYRDEDGKLLNADGKLGKRTYSAFCDFLTAHAPEPDKPEVCEMPEEMMIVQEVNGILYKGLLMKNNDEAEKPERSTNG